MRTTISKSVSIFISFALVMASVPMPAGSAQASAAVPDFVKAFTPSESLGFVDSYYQGATEHPIVLIQDLHANYGVQKKIEGVLQFLQSQKAFASRPMILGIEGAWGTISLASIQNESEKVRATAVDFLLKNAEISGMEHFAVLSKNEVHLVGIDNPEDYFVHTQLFQKSLAARLALAQKTDKLRYAINGSKGEAPRELQRIWKIEDAFHAGQLSLADMSKKLGVSLESYKEAEAILSREKLNLANKQQGKNSLLVKNITEADQNLSLLGRLLRQQLSLEEVQGAAKRIPAMLTTVQALLPGENVNLWNDTIRTAIDHYAVAILRDKPLSEHAFQLAQQHADRSVVIVTGGFHTQGIVNFLKQRKMSYVVIAPVVESHTARDEAVYVKRMLDIHVTNAEITKGLRMVPGNQSVTPPSAGFFNPADNPQAVTSRFPNASSVVSRVLSGIKAGRIPASTDQTAASSAVDELVAPSVNLNPGVLQRIKITLKAIIGRPEQISVAQTPAADAVHVALDQAGGLPISRKGLGMPPIITFGTIGASLATVRIADAAQQAVHHAANSGVTSTALAIGAGVAVLGGVTAWFTKTKRGQDALKRARDIAINGAA